MSGIYLKRNHIDNSNEEVSSLNIEPKLEAISIELFEVHLNTLKARPFLSYTYFCVQLWNCPAYTLTPEKHYRMGLEIEETQSQMLKKYKDTVTAY